MWLPVPEELRQILWEGEVSPDPEAEATFGVLAARKKCTAADATQAERG